MKKIMYLLAIICLFFLPQNGNSQEKELYIVIGDSVIANGAVDELSFPFNFKLEIETKLKTAMDEMIISGASLNGIQLNSDDIPSYIIAENHVTISNEDLNSFNDKVFLASSLVSTSRIGSAFDDIANELTNEGKKTVLFLTFISEGNGSTENALLDRYGCNLGPENRTAAVIKIPKNFQESDIDPLVRKIQSALGGARYGMNHHSENGSNIPFFPQDGNIRCYNGVAEKNTEDQSLRAHPYIDSQVVKYILRTGRLTTLSNDSIAYLGIRDFDELCITALIEECDGIDNNGDGVIDEGFPDTDGDSIADCVDIEECDGIDNDGNGLIDDNLEIFTYYLDDDSDQLGDSNNSLDTCALSPPNGYVDNSDDCDDSVALSQEVCDGIDNDCDGIIDDNIDVFTYYLDEDGDGDGDENISIDTCLSTAPANYVINSDDCDDENADINSNADEIPNNEIDEDCDGIALVIDIDGDGFNSDEDCDDENPNINPGAIDIPNNEIDEDCSGLDSMTLSVAYQALGDIAIYPNPAIHNLTLNCDCQQNFELIIYTITGQKKIEIQASDMSIIDISELNAGAYIIELIQDDTHYIQKLIKL